MEDGGGSQDAPHRTTLDLGVALLVAPGGIQSFSYLKYKLSRNNASKKKTVHPKKTHELVVEVVLLHHRKNKENFLTTSQLS
jgi:hypothetical protein